eukprot:298660-Chlamydomonas_euryale.AAC.1
MPPCVPTNMSTLPHHLLALRPRVLQRRRLLQSARHEAVERAAEVEHVAASRVEKVKRGQVRDALDEHLDLQ